MADATHAPLAVASAARPTWRVAFGLVVIGTATYAVFPTHPLYSENQNTKFLYGLAKAGVGRLKDDWLVAQGSELPVFDALVYCTRGFGAEWMFYAWHLAVVIAYTLAVYGIARVVGLTEPDRLGRGGRWFLPIFGIWFVGLNTNNATGRLFEGVAHQYIQGPVFEPQSFGVLALLALLLFRLGETGWATVLIVAAAWIHPAYAIPGLMLLLGMTVARWRFGASVNAPPLVIAAGVLGCLSAAGFTYSLLQPSDPSVQAEAVRIITQLRIAKHSLPGIWVPDIDTQAKLVFACIAIWLTRRDPLGWVLLVLLAGIAILTAWVWVSGDMQLALAAPWRASVILIPAVNAILLAQIIQWVAGRVSNHPRIRWIPLCVTAVAVLVGLGFAARAKIEKYLLREHPAYFAWVRSNAKDGDQFLTPVDETDFRLATGQPQYVTWKSHPYRGSSVLDWYGRLNRARAVTEHPAPDCIVLDALAAEGVTHLVRAAALGDPKCSDWEVVYADDQFVISAKVNRGR